MTKHTTIFISALFAMGLICQAKESADPRILKFPHGEWISIADGVDITAGPQDTNTFADSKITIQLYIRTRDGVFPNIDVGDVDLTIPDTSGIPHTDVKLSDILVWKKTSVDGVYVASVAEVKLTPKGRWGVSVLAKLDVNSETKRVATTTCYFAVR